MKTIGLIAPSGNIKNFEEINEKIKLLEKNFKVKKFYNETSYRYLSDTDENRVEFLHKAFLDDEVDIVLSVRGGFGAIRIVDKINYSLIKNSSKIYLGSSDATILLIALSQKTNIKCFHSLMLTNGFLDNLENNLKIIEKNSFNLNPKAINYSSCKGILWGGNLSTIVSLFSNDKYLPKEDIILFLEDLNEPLYKIDKMFYEIYRNQKLREKMKGIIFGDFYLEDEEIFPVLKEYSNLYNIPCFIDKNITHKPNNITLPFRKTIEL